MTIDKKYLGRILLSYGLFAALGLSLAALGPLLNDLHKITGEPLKSISWLFTVRSIGGLTGALLGVRLFDKHSVKHLLLFVIPTMALMFFLIPWFKDLWIIILLFLVSGFAHSMIDASGNLTVAAHRKGAGPLLSILHFSFGAGALLIPLVINYFRARAWQPIRSLWVITAVFGVLWIGNMIMKPVVTAGHKKQTGQKSSIPLLLLFSTSIFFFFFTGIEVGFSGWMVNFTQDSGFLDEFGANRLISLYFAIYTSMRLLTAPLTTWIKSRDLLLIAMIGASLVLLLFNIIPLNPVILTVGTLLLGICLAPGFPMFLSTMQEEFGLSGKTTSFVMAGAFSGGMFFPWFIGQFFESVGPMILMRILTVNILIAVAMLLFIRKQSTVEMAKRENGGEIGGSEPRIIQKTGYKNA